MMPRFDIMVSEINDKCTLPWVVVVDYFEQRIKELNEYNV